MSNDTDQTSTRIQGRAWHSQLSVRRTGRLGRLCAHRGDGREALSRGLPRVVYILAAGTVLMGTTEFMIAGLLPDISHGLHVSEARSGLLITAFAIGMIVGSPMMALATRRWPQRSVLTLALVVFAAGHVVAALSSSFAILLCARVLTALATGAFWAVDAVVASDAAGPGASTRAIGVVIGG